VLRAHLPTRPEISAGHRLKMSAADIRSTDEFDIILPVLSPRGNRRGKLHSIYAGSNGGKTDKC
jgi:hypothetical protein